METRGVNETCLVCYWEDDGQDEHDRDEVRGGTNGTLSLAEAQHNYETIGACAAQWVKYVREPFPEERKYKDPEYRRRELGL
jgi:hypothetical protein